MSSPLTGNFICGTPLACSNFSISVIQTEIFNPIERDLERYECFSPFTLLYRVYVPGRSVYITQDYNWIYADFFDVGTYSARVWVCIHARGNSCFGTSILLGSVRLVISANSKRLFPSGIRYYLDSRAEHVDDIALAVRVSNSLPFFNEYYNQLYVSEKLM